MGSGHDEPGNGSPDPFTGLATCLSTRNQWPEMERSRLQTYRSMGFPDYDLCAGTLDEKFDIIIVEQVFEHLLWPYRAARNVFQMLNPEGALLVTTPFLVKVHNSPVDCSRWTELGLRHLLAEGGFDIDRITTGSWGNRACVRSNWWKWTIYQPWLHSLRNEPEFPFHVWALARK